MKAAQFDSYGDSSVIDVRDAAKPAVSAGHVLVGVHAASLNRIDSAIRSGAMRQMIPLQFPATIGGDFAGVVAGVGQGVSDFKTGDEVYGQAGIATGGSGTLAEFTVADAQRIAKKPASVNMPDAASLPLVGASALQALEEHLKLQKGQRILIQGGAGGIGSLAIQIAKLHEAYVATTVSTEDMAFARSLGADTVIDYTSEDAGKLAPDFDAIFVTARAALDESVRLAKQGGIVVSMVGPAGEALAKERSVTVVPQMTKNTTEQFTRLAELVDSGKLKPEVEKTFPLAEAREAFRYFETEHPNGKVVVEIRP